MGVMGGRAVVPFRELGELDVMPIISVGAGELAGSRTRSARRPKVPWPSA